MIKEFVGLLFCLGMFIYSQGIPTRGWFIFICLLFSLWISQKIANKGVLSEKSKNNIWLGLIISCIGIHNLINEYGSKDPNSYWLRNNALIFQKVEFKGPFFDPRTRHTVRIRSVHLNRELKKDDFPDLNWSHFGHDLVWEEYDKHPSKKGYIVAKGIYFQPKKIRLAPLELIYNDENGTEVKVKLSFYHEGDNLNSWHNISAEVDFDKNRTTRKSYEILLPKKLDNMFLKDLDLEFRYLLNYGWLFEDPEDWRERVKEYLDESKRLDK